MAATGGPYTQTVPLDPDESYELRGLRQTRRASIAPQESRHRTAGDVSFVGVGHVGIRALADFRQPYPLSPDEALVSRVSLPDLPRSVCVAVTNAARPWRAGWSAVIFVIAGLPGR